MKKNIFVTGASGFVGRALCESLECRNFSVKAAMRSSSGKKIKNQVIVNDYFSITGDDLMDCDTVIHLAARAHILNEEADNPEYIFMKANRDTTVSLAKAAVEASVRRFIFVSSIGVNGNQTIRKPFCEIDKVNPHDLYAKAKWEAEKELLSITKNTDLEVVIIRPTLVYGVGAKGNFQRLLKLLSLGLPLPFAAINNYRSLIGVENLCDLLICCIDHNNAPGQVFLAADDGYVSTPDLLKTLLLGLNQKDRLFYFPVMLLKLLLTIVGKKTEFDKFCGSLQVDTSKVNQLLNWYPPFSQREGLLKMASEYNSSKTL